ncbi:anti-sigma regulatory factor (Ser/Thr protein kinase) [Catenulispora sp. GP43]|uniref:ATP-binding protein n=1 Tax=Catenulispora sp. GP43 TaxID=3156263 RepID=UPI003516E708
MSEQETPEHAAPDDGRLVITSDQSDLAGARQITAGHLRECCDWVDRDAVLLVVSELLSNAVLHGGGWWRLTVTASPGQLRIEVEDKESLVPSIRQVDMKGAPGGLGMHIISKLVTSYEAAVHPAGTGKTVRALWSRPGLPA